MAYRGARGWAGIDEAIRAHSAVDRLRKRIEVLEEANAYWQAEFLALETAGILTRNSGGRFSLARGAPAEAVGGDGAVPGSEAPDAGGVPNGLPGANGASVPSNIVPLDREEAARLRRARAEAEAPIVNAPLSQRYAGIVGPEDNPMGRSPLERFDNTGKVW